MADRTVREVIHTIGDEHRIARPGALDGAHAVGQAGARGDGHGQASAEDTEPLVGQGWDATGDLAFGEVGHEAKCSPSPRTVMATGSLGR